MQVSAYPPGLELGRVSTVMPLTPTSSTSDAKSTREKMGRTQSLEGKTPQELRRQSVFDCVPRWTPIGAPPRAFRRLASNTCAQAHICSLLMRPFARLPETVDLSTLIEGEPLDDAPGAPPPQICQFARLLPCRPLVLRTAGRSTSSEQGK